MEYQELDVLISQVNPDLSAAHLHGLAIGMLCANLNTDTSVWFDHILEDGQHLNESDEDILRQLYAETQDTLLEDEFSIQLCLPDEDDVCFDKQVGAVQEWCQGFLYGFGVVSGNDQWPEDIEEIIRDITEFTKISVDDEGQDAESDLMELIEYLRTAIIYLKTQLNSDAKNVLH